MKEKGIAMLLTTPDEIRTLQRKLYTKAKQESAYRFYALYDKVWRADILMFAYRLVRANKGSPGIDGMNFDDIEQKIGVDRFFVGTCSRSEKQDLSPKSGTARHDPQSGRQSASAGDTDDPRPGSPDGGEARHRADI